MSDPLPLHPALARELARLGIVAGQLPDAYTWYDLLQALSRTLYDHAAPTDDARPPNAALETRLRHEAGLADAARALMAGTLTEDSLNTALRHLRAAFHASRVYVFENHTVAEHGLGYRWTHEVTAPGVAPAIDQPALQAVPYSSGLAGWPAALGGGNPLVCRPNDLPDAERSVVCAGHDYSALILPLMIDGQWHGGLGVCDADPDRVWPDEDQRLWLVAATIVGSYIGMQMRERALGLTRHALEQGIQQSESRLHYEELLARMAFELLNGNLGNDTLPGALRFLREATGALRCMVFENRHDPNRGLCMVRRAEALASNTSALAVDTVWPYADGFARWQTLLSAGEMVVADVADLPDPERERLAPQGVHGVLVVPLMTDDDWLGFVGFDFDRPMDHWDDDELRLLRTGTALIATYLSNLERARSLEAARDTLEARVAERAAQMEYRTAQLQAVSEIARDAAVNVQDVDTLLQQAAAAAQTNLRLYHVGIYLLDDNGRHLVLSAASGAAASALLARAYRIPADAGTPIGDAVLKGQPQLIRASADNPVIFSSELFPATAAELTAPLRLGRDVLGVVDFHSDQPDTFSVEDVPILSVLADQLAIAIQNARLLEQNREALRELETQYAEQVKANWREHIDRAGRVTAYGHNQFGTEPITPETRHFFRSLVTAENDRTLIVGISLRGQRIGNIRLQREADQSAWTAEERQLVSEIGTQIAVALDNARLVEETRRALADTQRLAERDRLISAVTDRIHQETDIRSILETATAELRRATGRRKAAVRLELPE